MEGINLHLYQLYKNVPLSKNTIPIRNQRRSENLEREDDYLSEQARRNYREKRRDKQNFRRFLLSSLSLAGAWSDKNYEVVSVDCN